MREDLGEVKEIIESLDELSQRISTIAHGYLTAAIDKLEEGYDKKSLEEIKVEKELVRARRACEKAALILRSIV